MEYIVPLNNFTDAGLRQQIHNKLVQVKALEEALPAVLIVHQASDFSVVYMSKRGLDNLGVTLDAIRLPNAEYHARYFNLEDAQDYVPKIKSLLQRNNNDEMVTFFQQVRPSPQHEWGWYLSSVKIFMRDNEGQPLLTLTMALPIDAQHHITNKVERLLQENNFLRSNQHIYGSLTAREKEVLQLMALGYSAQAVAAKLFIAEATALTHRRNIKSKLGTQTNYEITKFAQAFNLI